MVNKNVVEDLVKNYLNLKKHEYKSITSKINSTNSKFVSKIEKNTHKNHTDIHIILLYNYTNYKIREDKFYHILDDELIDIYYFIKDRDDLNELLSKKIKKLLKPFKVTTDMIDLALSITNDNFYVAEDGLNFIYSYSQFGINDTKDFKILINYKDIYDNI